MHVVVVGAGIMGASVAHYLSVAGHEVTLLEQGHQPAIGVTAKGFGWINLIHLNPDHQESFSLRVAAFDEYRRLRRELPNAFSDVREGALVWQSTAVETTGLAKYLHAAGVELEVVDSANFSRLEPNLKDYPPIAILAQSDLAISPSLLATKLVEAAISHGAKLICNAPVQCLKVNADRVVGVDVGQRFLSADSVVLAAGPQTDELLEPLGLKLGVTTSPAVLLRFSAPTVKIARVLAGPLLEVRPSADGTLTVAEEWPSDSDVEKVQYRAKSAIEFIFGAHGKVSLLSAEVGQRPTFHDGLPRYGPVAGLKGCHVAVGHPGVILAPLLGRRIAECIAD